MSERLNVLIVGQGLAGSMLSWYLMQENVPVAVVDSYPVNNATRVAAGIIIPITGRRLAKTNKADELIPVAFETYHEIEKQTQTEFFFEKDVLQVFTSVSNRNEWYSRTAEEGMQGYYSDFISKPKMPVSIQNEYGGIVLKNSGYIDTQKFSDVIRKFLNDNGSFINEEFEYADLQLMENGVDWRGSHYSHIVFCEGSRATKNPWFPHVAFKPAKGEILDFTSYELEDTFIISSSSIYILPLGKNKFRAGATYEWNDLTESATVTGRDYLEKNIRKAINVSYEVTGHKAGIRPAMLDRRPCLGMHHKFPALAMFNGLGTKGALLSPYYARMMARCIIAKQEPETEVSIKRFERFYQEL